MGNTPYDTDGIRKQVVFVQSDMDILQYINNKDVKFSPYIKSLIRREMMKEDMKLEELHRNVETMSDTINSIYRQICTSNR